MNKFASGEYSGNLIFRKEILFLSCGAYVEVWKLRRCPQGQNAYSACGGSQPRSLRQRVDE